MRRRAPRCQGREGSSRPAPVRWRRAWIGLEGLASAGRTQSCSKPASASSAPRRPMVARWRKAHGRDGRRSTLQPPQQVRNLRRRPKAATRGCKNAASVERRSYITQPRYAGCFKLSDNRREFGGSFGSTRLTGFYPGSASGGGDDVSGAVPTLRHEVSCRPTIPLTADSIALRPACRKLVGRVRGAGAADFPTRVGKRTGERRSMRAGHSRRQAIAGTWRSRRR
jgi:hypothetical protein